MLSDLFGLKFALTLTPVLALAAAVFFASTSRSDETDVARNRPEPEESQ